MHQTFGKDSEQPTLRSCTAERRDKDRYSRRTICRSSLNMLGLQVCRGEVREQPRILAKRNRESSPFRVGPAVGPPYWEIVMTVANHPARDAHANRTACELGCRDGMSQRLSFLLPVLNTIPLTQGNLQFSRTNVHTRIFYLHDQNINTRRSLESRFSCRYGPCAMRLHSLW
jgi:hypothetical protein